MNAIVNNDNILVKLLQCADRDTETVGPKYLIKVLRFSPLSRDVIMFSSVSKECRFRVNEYCQHFCGKDLLARMVEDVVENACRFPYSGSGENAIPTSRDQKQISRVSEALVRIIQARSKGQLGDLSMSETMKKDFDFLMMMLSQRYRTFFIELIVEFLETNSKKVDKEYFAIKANLFLYSDENGKSLIVPNSGKGSLLLLLNIPIQMALHRAVDAYVKGHIVIDIE